MEIALGSIEDDLGCYTSLTDLTVDTAAPHQIRRDWSSIIVILRGYKAELVGIVEHHPNLTADKRTVILHALSEMVEAELTDAEALLSEQPSDLPDFVAISYKVSFANLVLLMKGAELETIETYNLSSLDAAFSRLRRTTAFRTCMKHLRLLQATEAMQIYRDQVGADLSENMLAGTQPTNGVDVEDTNSPGGIACSLCHGTSEESTQGECGVTLLPCCNSAVHGCCMTLRLRRNFKICPECLHEWTEQEMAALIHDRVHQVSTEGSQQRHSQS
jgi:hypothetical protein